MRCVVCDHDNTRWWKDNFYCPKCLTAIKEVIREDRYMDKLEGRYKRESDEHST